MSFCKKVSAKYQITATGEMYADALEEGGEWYNARLALENVCDQAGLKCTVKPFDQYQGPYAELPNRDKLWLGQDEGSFVHQAFKNDKRLEDYFQHANHFEADEEEMVEHLEKYFAALKDVKKQKGGLKLVKGASPQDFEEYVWEFYQPGGMHGDFFGNKLTKAEVKAAIKLLQLVVGNLEEGDSVDRERIRDILLAAHGKLANI